MTQEQVEQLVNWYPNPSWRLVATLTAMPAPGSINQHYVRDWISFITDSIEFEGYAETLIITEIAPTHEYPLMHVLLGGIEEREPFYWEDRAQGEWAYQWEEEIGGGGADIKCFGKNQSKQAGRALMQRLSPVGKFCVEIDVGFAVLESSGTATYSKEWERLCTPHVQKHK